MQMRLKRAKEEKGKKHSSAECGARAHWVRGAAEKKKNYAARTRTTRQHSVFKARLHHSNITVYCVHERSNEADKGEEREENRKKKHMIKQSQSESGQIRRDRYKKREEKRYKTRNTGDTAQSNAEHTDTHTHTHTQVSAHTRETERSHSEANTGN